MPERGDIPAKIKAARQAKDLTQQELGEKLGYTGEFARVAIKRWESGERPVPLEKIRPLAAALNLTLDDLIP
jgi:transcriptional regulator with XRE-family HTH domain